MKKLVITLVLLGFLVWAASTTVLAATPSKPPPSIATGDVDANASDGFYINGDYVK